MYVYNIYIYVYVYTYNIYIYIHIYVYTYIPSAQRGMHNVQDTTLAGKNQNLPSVQAVNMLVWVVNTCKTRHWQAKTKIYPLYSVQVVNMLKYAGVGSNFFFNFFFFWQCNKT